MSKPRIIVLSSDNDDTFCWLSDGWNMVSQHGQEDARLLMHKATQAIDQGDSVTAVVKLLEQAGFEVTR